MNKNLKYNYVIFGTNMDLYMVSYNDLKNLKNARYLTEGIYTKNFFLKLLYKIHTSQRLNMIISLPFKNIWNKLAYVNDFDDDKPVCYIFFAGTYWFSKDYIAYLRKKQPDCKIVIFYQDLIKTHLKLFDETKNLTDLTITFDLGDAKHYGIIYHPLVYSYYNELKDRGYSSDVYFVGKAKDRLDLIISVYEKLKDYGLNCDFHITGVPQEKQKYVTEIDYCNYIDYSENLSHILGTKCLLEIMQGGGKGFTLRYAEAIMYDKKMITNNPEIKNAEFYSNDKILTINDEKDVSEDFLKSLGQKITYKNKKELSPISFIEFVDNLLKKE